MVEVAPGKETLRIPVWKYVLFLIALFLITLLILYFLFASNFGARNPFMETLRKYLRIANVFRPDIKPEDNFASALKIHGFTKTGSKRFYFFVSATDGKGAPLTSLNPAQVSLKIKDQSGADIRVMVDRIRPLHLYKDLVAPLAFSSVMDYSGSMFPQDIQSIESNFSTFIDDLLLPPVGAVIKFNDDAIVVSDLTEDPKQILAAIKKPVALKNTALYDGIDKGVEKIQAQPNFKFMVLTTDGNDNASSTTIEEAIRRCRQHNVSIFAFGFGWLDVDVLKKLSENTDGYYSYVPDSANLDEWFSKTVKIINHVQVIEFSTDQDMNAPGETELSVNDGNVKLTRTRTWN